MSDESEEQPRWLEPIIIGPTWQRDEDGKFILPERTLGWGILGWCAEWLQNENGEPWTFTNEQARFVLWWYAVDEQGRFLYQTGVMQRLKGHGKSPFGAALCLAELCGPSQFSHFDEDGEAVGKRNTKAWVQVAAVSRDQTKNVTDQLIVLMTDDFIQSYGVEPGKEVTRAFNGKNRLETVTSSFRSAEGNRTTFSILDEPHHWVEGNGGHKLFEVIENNNVKSGGRILLLTNAYLPGEDSVLERIREQHNKFLEGSLQYDPGILYDSIEAHPETPLTPEGIRKVVPIIRGDSVWLDPERIVKSILNAAVSPARSRRMWLSQITADEDALLTDVDWRACEDSTLVLEPDDEIVLGFDGGKTDDATALVALRLSDNALFLLGLWEKLDTPDHEDWEVDQERVDSTVAEAFQTYKVRGFYADVALWESWIAEWANRYGEGLGIKASERNPIAWDMRTSRRFVTHAHERFLRSFLDKKLKHDGNLNLRRHFLNTRRRVNDDGVYFGKESRESKRKVDAYAASMLAHEAAYDYRNRGKKTQERGGGLWLM